MGADGVKKKDRTAREFFSFLFFVFLLVVFCCFCSSFFPLVVVVVMVMAMVMAMDGGWSVGERDRAALFVRAAVFLSFFLSCVNKQGQSRSLCRARLDRETARREREPCGERPA